MRLRLKWKEYPNRSDLPPDSNLSSHRRGCLGRERLRPPSRRIALKKKGASLDAPFSSIRTGDYAQVITPLVMSQTFADWEWVAFALHEGGGPATLVTTTVTFCEGVNP
jgi:hypothetical protein